MSVSLASFGPGLMLFSNVFYSAGAFLADWNETHIHNPRWPPHAKFHNGQTMSLGVGLASVATYLIIRTTTSAMQKRDDLFNAAVVGSLYCGAGLTAILYPGTAWADPEFNVQGAPQLKIFGGQVLLNWLGWWLATQKIKST